MTTEDNERARETPLELCVSTLPHRRTAFTDAAMDGRSLEELNEGGEDSDDDSDDDEPGEPGRFDSPQIREIHNFLVGQGSTGKNTKTRSA